MLIQDGYLLEGTLCKKTLGASGGSLVHIIFMEVCVCTSSLTQGPLLCSMSCCAVLAALTDKDGILPRWYCKECICKIPVVQAGPEAARAFLSQCQYVANYWMLQHGFSIGIGDTVADGATMLVINQTINRVCTQRLLFIVCCCCWPVFLHVLLTSTESSVLTTS